MPREQRQYYTLLARKCITAYENRDAGLFTRGSSHLHRARERVCLLEAVLVEETRDAWVGHRPPVVVVAAEEPGQDGDLRVTWNFRDYDMSQGISRSYSELRQYVVAGIYCKYLRKNAVTCRSVH